MACSRLFSIDGRHIRIFEPLTFIKLIRRQQIELKRVDFYSSTREYILSMTVAPLSLIQSFRFRFDKYTIKLKVNVDGRLAFIK